MHRPHIRLPEAVYAPATADEAPAIQYVGTLRTPLNHREPQVLLHEPISFGSEICILRLSTVILSA
jgi:hypothetical protein